MSANREMNAAMKGSLSCEDSGMEEYIMKLVPLGDRVVIKALVAEETTKSGIVLPGQAKEKPQQAEVIAVGPGGVVDGKEVVMQVKPGDKVIYSKYSGTEVKLDEDENLIQHICLIVERKSDMPDLSLRFHVLYKLKSA